MACIVVKRGEYAQYDRLYKAFGDRVPVVWDRRRNARPSQETTGAQPPERRNTLPTSWVSLGFVVAESSSK